MTGGRRRRCQYGSPAYQCEDKLPAADAARPLLAALEDPRRFAAAHTSCCGGGMSPKLFTCLVHRLFQVAIVTSVCVLLLSVFAWVEAVRLPDYANYREWRDGWHVGVRNAGTIDRPVWWETYAFVGQFPDKGVVPTPSADVLVSPYRFPDLRAHEVRLLWPVMLSLAAPLVWFVRRFRPTPDSRGFPVGRYPPAATDGAGVQSGPLANGGTSSKRS
jgi:hypothetical protein